jgi:hypothetical protein
MKLGRKPLGEYHRRKGCKVNLNEFERGLVHDLKEYFGEKHFNKVIRKCIELTHDHCKEDLKKGVRLGYVFP